MKLYLFGGAEPTLNQVQTLLQLINNVIAEIKPQQLLHIPYARIKVPEGEEELWGEGWVPKKLNLDGIKLLDARSEEGLAQARDPVIFINGGPQRDLLYEEITRNKRLYDLVVRARCIIGESAGSMVCAEYRRTYRDGCAVTTKGLGLLKSTIIEAHYSERNRHQSLRGEMKETGAQYGIGIDSITGVVIDTDKYPNGYKVIGNGLVEFVYKKDLE